MTEPVTPLVVDLSHWDPADNYDAVKADGIVGVIYKATEGQGYTDPTYVAQQQEAKQAGLKWGAYHFADGSNASGQIDNFLRFACPDPDELFALDWEDNPSGNGKMSVDQATTWVTEVERELGREGQCVIYGGNTLKEMLDEGDSFFGERRLWLCQYGSTPSLPGPWEAYWLWQYTDGVYGPSPHNIDGIGPCDINSYKGDVEQLVATWATGSDIRPPPTPDPGTGIVNILIQAPPGIVVRVRQFQRAPSRQRVDRRWEAGAHGEK